MPRAYVSVGWLKTTRVTNGWHAVGDADFELPWGTESPLHICQDHDYLVRWDEEAQRWELLHRARGT